MRPRENKKRAAAKPPHGVVCSRAEGGFLALTSTTAADFDPSEAGMGYFRGGYSGGYTRSSYVLITIFNFILAAILLTLISPVFLLMMLIVRLRLGRPIFYKGVRLGLRKRPFNMYKFRTLPIDAQQKIGSELLSSKHAMTTPFTRMLRESRLDELPQLLNILKGNMDFVGPRPMRPEVYQSCCLNIPGFDKRFQVRPGLVGYAQIFTPHSTPKRLRSYIDNRFLLRKRVLYWDIQMVFFAGLIFLRRASGIVITHYLRRLVLLLRKRQRQDNRAMERINQDTSQTVLRFVHEDGSVDTDSSPIIDINDSYLRMHSNLELEGPFEFVLDRTFLANRRRKRKRAHCHGVVHRRISIPNTEYGYKYSYILQFYPESPLNNYLVDQYFLRKSYA